MVIPWCFVHNHDGIFIISFEVSKSIILMSRYMNIKSVLILLYGKVSIMIRSIQIKTKVSKSTLLPASFYMNCSTMISMELLSVLFCKGRVPQPKTTWYYHGTFVSVGYQGHFYTKREFKYTHYIVKI